MAKTRNAAYAEEKAEVEVLKGHVAKYEDIGKRLRGLQGKLQGDGRSISDSLGPIKDNTRESQTVAKNIDRVVAHIEKMLISGQDKSREEAIIRAGPGQVGLDEYVGCMRRLDRALDQLNANKMRAQQQTVGDYNELLTQGILQLQEVFGSLLNQNSTPVEPLHYITKMKPFPLLPSDVASQLRSMERCLSSPNARRLSYNQRENVAVRLYSETRSTYLCNSLQSLALACISMSKRKNPNEPYRQGDAALDPYLSAMEGIFATEHQTVLAIFSREEQGFVFGESTRKAMSELSRTLRELNQQVRGNITMDCFLAFEIVDVVSKTSLKIGQETGELKSTFAEAMKPVRDVAKSAMTELLDDQRHRINTMQSLPPDGAATPFTTETMTRLQTMTQYSKAVSSILASLGDGGWMSSGASQSSNRSLDVGADGTALLARYCLDTIDVHLTTLYHRSNSIHKSKAHTGVMLYNSIAVIDRMIRSSDLATLFSGQTNAQNKMDNWRKKAISTYMDSWKEPSGALLDVVYTNRATNRPPSGSSIPSTDIIKGLSSKDKDSIKDKFKHFNLSFDECVRRFKEMSPAMEREVRSGLAREINNMITPLYDRFFDKYEALDRGRGKYVRYDKGSLSVALAGLG